MIRAVSDPGEFYVMASLRPPLTAWERGYICRRCRTGPWRFARCRAAARRRLCMVCWETVRWLGIVANYPEQALPARQYSEQRTGEERKRLWSLGRRCVVCGKAICDVAVRCKRCAAFARHSCRGILTRGGNCSTIMEVADASPGD